MRKSNLVFIGLFGLMLFWQCGQDAPASEQEDSEATEESAGTDTETAASDPQKAMEEAMKQLQNMQNGEKVEVVDFRKLKEMLPATLAGMERTDISGEKAGAMGFTISTANATYKSDGKKVEVTIVDGGGVGMAQMGLAAWAMAEIDQEDDNGWKKTTTIAGQKAYQEHNTRDKSGQVSLLVGGRGVMTIEYDGMDSGDAEKLLKGLDVNGVANLFKAAN
ncbi:MAG: hypothetical protein KDC34_17705 [Saprospiraceae bacterium]|nr:hypothetical protein [Saprospiraceae bacterium]